MGQAEFCFARNSPGQSFFTIDQAKGKILLEASERPVRAACFWQGRRPRRPQAEVWQHQVPSGVGLNDAKPRPQAAARRVPKASWCRADRGRWRCLWRCPLQGFSRAGPSWAEVTRPRIGKPAGLSMSRVGPPSRGNKPKAWPAGHFASGGLSRRSREGRRPKSGNIRCREASG